VNLLNVAKERLSVLRPTVLVADDHPVMLERALSILKPNVEVVGTANNGIALIDEARRLQPDVIVLDITMPTLNGIEAAHELHEIGSMAKFVFLTVHDRLEFVQACIAEGALGYVTKSRMATDLIPAINEALSGHLFISPTVPR
jgi:DNA-binding NarL/FixJ family response regulator